jgi:hypothetical protein
LAQEKALSFSGFVNRWRKLARGVDAGLKSVNGIDTIIIRARGLICRGWFIFTARFRKQSFLFPPDIFHKMLHFKPDGTQLYINDTRATNGKLVVSFNLGTPWDSESNSLNTTFTLTDILDQRESGHTRNITGVFDALGKFFFAVQQGRNSLNDDVVEIQTYTMSTDWDISTLAFSSRLYYSDEPFTVSDIRFSTDGYKMFIFERPVSPLPFPGELKEYNLSVPWDVSTATFAYNLALTDGPRYIYFQPSGSLLFVARQSTSAWSKFTLSTAWDLSSAVEVNDNPKVGQLIPIFGTNWSFKPDGRRMYIIGLVSAPGIAIHEYDLCLEQEG